jgi:hypothetical protein
MAANNATQLLADQLDIATLARRAHALLQEPTVRKAWCEALGAAEVALAAAREALDETRTCWSGTS